MERTIQYSDNNLIIQQVLSKFSFSLLFMTIGMIVGASGRGSANADCLLVCTFGSIYSA